MIKVDIVSPKGGLYGGIENAIKSWTQNLDASRFDLRVIHFEPGVAYLKGYPKSYFITEQPEKIDFNYCIAAYEVMIQKLGAPDICIATNWPMMSKVCSIVRQNHNLNNMKIMSWVHSRIEEYSKAGLGGVEDMLFAEAHFALNSQTQQQLLEADPLAKVYTIGNPVDPPPHMNENPIPLLLAYVGRIDYTKRIDIILEGICRAKAPWKLRIIGAGDIGDALNSWIKTLRLEQRVELVGWKEDPWECCKDTGILVMASEYEGFSMVAIEAEAHGMTVISTPVDGTVDCIIPGFNGYLFEQEDAAGLARILDGISDGSIPLFEPKKCAESVAKFYTPTYFNNVQQALEEVYSL